MATQVGGTAAVGEQVPDFALPTLAGDQVRLSDLRGTRLVLYCWASW